MADIQFDEEQQYQRPREVNQKPFFIRLVLATGIVADDRQAEYVLLGVAVLAVILAFVIPSLLSSSSPQIPQAQIDQYIKAMKTR